MQQHHTWLQDFLVFFAAAGLVVPLFHRLRLGAVLGFLLVGIAVGPQGLALLSGEYPWLKYLVIEDRERVEPFAELGVMFLLFIVGLELSLARLWSLRRFVLGIGGTQVSLCATAIALIAIAGGLSAQPAIVVGIALAMSSTAIVVQLLEEQGRTATTEGRVAFSVLLFQDLMVAPALFITGVLSRGGDNLYGALAYALVQAVAAIGIIVVLGRFVLRPLLSFTARTGSREFILAVTILIVVAVAAGTGLAGLSTALGAFLAGLLLAETEHRHHLEVDLAPFKGLLIGVFFVTVGMSLDLNFVFANLAWIATAVLALLALKALILFGAALLFRSSLRTSLDVALLLPQAGEFAFIIVGLARGGGLLEPTIAQAVTAIAVLSMLLTPALARAARGLGERLHAREHRGHAPSGEERFAEHVVIGGFGRVGRQIAELLEAENIPYVALDIDGPMVAAESKRKRPIFFGDASRLELLERVGAGKARGFVVTLDAPHQAERMIAAIRKTRPDAVIFARAQDAEHARRLMKAGAHAVIPEAVEASLQLGGQVLEGLGVTEEAVEKRIDAARQRELDRLRADATA